MTRDIEKNVLPFCRERQIGVIVYSPMKSGLLTGKMTRERIASLPPDDFRPRTASFKEPLLILLVRLIQLVAHNKSALIGYPTVDRRNEGREFLPWLFLDVVLQRLKN